MINDNMEQIKWHCSSEVWEGIEKENLIKNSQHIVQTPLKIRQWNQGLMKRINRDTEGLLVGAT